MELRPLFPDYNHPCLLIIRYRHLPWLDAFLRSQAGGYRPYRPGGLFRGKELFTGIKDMLVAAVVFVGLYLLKINPLIIIVMAAILGIVIY